MNFDSCVGVDEGTEISEFIKKCLHLCSEGERKTYGFGMT